jgi:hypothetical protein
VTGPEVRDIVENALRAVHAWLVNFEARQDQGAFGSAPIHVVAGGNANIERNGCIQDETVFLAKVRCH